MSAITALHARPRLDAISTLAKMAPAPKAHGGLSPAAMRRVREYVDAHLGDSMDLATLAGVAGVSIHHFARGFKQSAGVTPHHYLTQKRVERAQEMLAHPHLSLSEIAYAVGFSDQSHLARHFRQMLGVTPGQFRWSQGQQSGLENQSAMRSAQLRKFSRQNPKPRTKSTQVSAAPSLHRGQIGARPSQTQQSASSHFSAGP